MSDIIEDPAYLYAKSPAALMVVAQRDPRASDNQYDAGQLWISELPNGSGNTFALVGFINGVPDWRSLSESQLGPVLSLTGDSGTPALPDNSGNIKLHSFLDNQFVIVSDGPSNTVGFQVANPFNIEGFETNGTVNLNTSTNDIINMGNISGTTQDININPARTVNIGTTSTVVTSGINIGNSSNTNHQVNINPGSRLNLGTISTIGVTIGNSAGAVNIPSFTNFTEGVQTQGSLSFPTKGWSIIDGTISVVISQAAITTGIYNATGSEGVIQCAPVSLVTINLSGNTTPGSYITIYDSLGSAGTSNIRINAPAGGNILISGSVPSSSYVISTNYGNVCLYQIPLTSDFIVLNH